MRKIISVIMFAMNSYALAQTSPFFEREINIPRLCAQSSGGGPHHLIGPYFNRETYLDNPQISLDALKNKKLQAWNSAVFPFLEMKEKTFISRGGVLDLIWPADVMLEMLEKPQTISNFYNSAKQTKINLMSGYDLTDAKTIEQKKSIGFLVKMALPFVCADIDANLKKECVSALKDTVQIMSPILNTANYPLHVRVLRSDSYTEGLRRAAIRILQRFINNEVDPKAHLYGDLYKAFEDSGTKESEIDNLVWDSIAILSSHSASVGEMIGIYSTSKSGDIRKVALSAIALSIPKLDTLSKGTGHLYSFPPNIKTDCDSGKPYHFWMSAYLTRRLIKEGHSPKAAMAGVFGAQKGYQMQSKSPGRDPNRAFTQDAYSDWNNMMRIDLAHSIGAALFANAHLLKIKSEINLNEAINQIMKAGANLEAISYEAASEKWKWTGREGYSRWQQMFQPESVYKWGSEIMTEQLKYK